MTRPGPVAGPQASVQDVEKLRESMGLNEPMLVQYKDYVLGVLQGDFGTSYSYNQPVLKLVAERIPNTLLLAIPSIAVALLIGMVIGVVSAVKQGSLFDYIFMILALIGVSMPIFWMGLMLVLTFSVRLGWLPALGMGAFENGLGDVIRHMVLPCFCLSTIPMATFARITRFQYPGIHFKRFHTGHQSQRNQGRHRYMEVRFKERPSSHRHSPGPSAGILFCRRHPDGKRVFLARHGFPDGGRHRQP